MAIWKNNKYLILRRIVQLTILLLFVGGNYWGWTVLKGDLSSAKVLNTIHFSDPFMVLQTLTSGYILTLDIWIGAITVFVLYSVFFGRAFCSWVCPMNIITDLAARTRKMLRLFLEKVNVPITRNLRYWILLLSLIMSFLSGVAAFELVSPISILHRGIIFGMGMGWAAITLVFLFDLFVIQRGWCGYLCPLGAFYTGINRISLLKVQHDHIKCTACNKCLLVCPEKQILLPYINKETTQIYGSECTNCGRCIDVCDDNALWFSLNKFEKLSVIESIKQK